jgi:predicted N-acetyltransferase YhbS
MEVKIMDTGFKSISREITLRKGQRADAKVLGRICHDAFASISSKHNFPKDFPSTQAGIDFMEMMLSRPDIYSVVAEKGGKLLGSNFLWESDSVAGVGPITVDPELQNSSVGRALMTDVIQRADKNGALSVRLLQAAYHNRSLALYTKLGFDTVEPLSNLQGSPIKVEMDGYSVRPMTESDISRADGLCFRVHGHTRHNEIVASVQQGSAVVVERGGRITGYSTGVGFFGHSLGESNDDLKALIAAAEEFHGPGFLLPTRNGELLRWCLQNGLKIIQPMTLMAKGIYQEPRGPFLPSILY